MTRHAALPVRPARTAGQKRALLELGQRMSNVFYNMKESADVPESWRKQAEHFVREWDAIARGSR